MPISGLAVAYTTLGGILLWSGIKGETLAQTIKDVASGKPPVANQEPIGTPSLGIGSGNSSSSTTGSTAPSGSNPASAPGAGNGCTASQTAANKTTGQLMATAYGWGSGTEWTDLNNIVMAESQWCQNAQNSGSTAYGIGQFLDTTWASTGFTKSSNPVTQIAAMLVYIKQRYGDPINAWAFHYHNGYY